MFRTRMNGVRSACPFYSFFLLPFSPFWVPNGNEIASCLPFVLDRPDFVFHLLQFCLVRGSQSRSLTNIVITIQGFASVNRSHLLRIFPPPRTVNTAVFWRRISLLQLRLATNSSVWPRKSKAKTFSSANSTRNSKRPPPDYIKRKRVWKLIPDHIVSLQSLSHKLAFNDVQIVLRKLPYLSCGAVVSSSSGTFFSH